MPFRSAVLQTQNYIWQWVIPSRLRQTIMAAVQALMWILRLTLLRICSSRCGCSSKQKGTQKNQIHNGPLPTVSQRYADVLQLTTIGGAEAVGLNDFIGSITPGKRADILLTKCHSTRLAPTHDPVAALVLFANASGVDSVFIDGKLVKDKGKLVGGQLAQVAYRIDGVSGKYHGVIKKGTKGGNCGTDCYNCCKIFR
jgi:hypothetical protein